MSLALMQRPTQHLDTLQHPMQLWRQISGLQQQGVVQIGKCLCTSQIPPTMNSLYCKISSPALTSWVINNCQSKANPNPYTRSNLGPDCDKFLLTFVKHLLSHFKLPIQGMCVCSTTDTDGNHTPNCFTILRH